MKKHPEILVINPGSTSTKLGYFTGTRPEEIKSVNHLTDAKWNTLTEELQFEIRLRETEIFVRHRKPDIIMARGGLLKPLPSGVYVINNKMLDDLKRSPMKHASNSAAPIAKMISDKLGVPAYIADPVTVDELDDIARFSGHPLFQRKSVFHALNHKAVARTYARQKGKNYEDLNLIVVHMGGGISIGAHKKGKVVDVNQALDGEGPFSPERSGTLPAGDLVRTAFSGKFTRVQMLEMITGKGGVKAYTNTADIKEILEKNNPEQVKTVDAMIYQIAKYVGEMIIVFKGNVDAILLTGGLAKSGYIINNLKSYLSFLNLDIRVFPGENELEALAFNGTLLWNGQIDAKIYK